MKLHLSDLHMVGSKVHHLHEKEQRWVSSHIMVVSIMIACLASALVVYLLSMVQFYMTTGQWVR